MCSEKDKGPKKDIQKALESVESAKSRIEENIKDNRELYGKLEYISFYLKDQDATFTADAGFSTAYGSTASAMASSASTY